MLTLDQARELLLAWDRTGGHPYRDAAVVIAAPDGAKLTIEEYIFSLNPWEFEAAEISPDGRSRRFLPGLPKKDLDGLAWGRSCTWKATGHPQVMFKARELKINVHTPGVCYVDVLQAHRRNGQLGGLADAAGFARGQALTHEWLHPKCAMQVCGFWTVTVPPGFTAHAPFVLSLDFAGLAIVEVVSQKEVDGP